MKIRKLHLILLALVAIAGLASCGGSKEPSALVAQCERLNGEFAAMASDSPMFVDSVSCAYADAAIGVLVRFSDPTLSVQAISEPLAEWIVSQYLKAHATPETADILNTLGKEEGHMDLTFAGSDGSRVSYSFTSSRLKKLLQARNSELNLAAARTSVNDILAGRCATYAEAVKALGAEYEFQGGFAQYTLTFKDARMLANQTSGTLQGRYRPVLSQQFGELGACRDFVTDVLRSLGYDGFRFIYAADGSDKTVKTAIAWRYIQ